MKLIYFLSVFVLMTALVRSDWSDEFRDGLVNPPNFKDWLFNILLASTLFRFGSYVVNKFRSPVTTVPPYYLQGNYYNMPPRGFGEPGFEAGVNEQNDKFFDFLKTVFSQQDKLQNQNDDDKLFLLSLYSDLKAIPDFMKLKVKNMIVDALFSAKKSIGRSIGSIASNLPTSPSMTVRPGSSKDLLSLTEDDNNLQIDSKKLLKNKINEIISSAKQVSYSSPSTKVPTSPYITVQPSIAKKIFSTRNPTDRPVRSTVFGFLNKLL